MVPIHLHSNHWTLAVLVLGGLSSGGTSFTVEASYNDSLKGGDGPGIIAHLILWLCDEFQARKSVGGACPDPLPQRLPASFNEGPQQCNGNDCGVFVCETARCKARGQPLSFGQQDIPFIRKCMALEINRGSLEAAER